MARLSEKDLLEALKILDFPSDKKPTLDEVKRRRRELNNKLHPDKSGGSEYFTKQVNHAFEIISDWLKTGRPWPSENSSNEEQTARQKAEERARKEREQRQREEQQRQEQAQSETKSQEKKGADSEAEWDYAKQHYKDFFKNAGTGGGENKVDPSVFRAKYNKRKRIEFQNRIARNLLLVSASMLATYIGIFSEGFTYWPIDKETPTHVLLCFDDHSQQTPQLRQAGYNQVADNSSMLWGFLFYSNTKIWKKYPVYHIDGQPWRPPSQPWIIRVDWEMHHSRQGQACELWETTYAYVLDDYMDAIETGKPITATVVPR